MAGSTPVARVFDRVARIYDLSLLQRLVYRPAQDMTIDELRASGSKRVLDVGCGTGIFSARMREELGIDVIGCDLSPGMLEQARARSDGVGWVLGDSGRLPLPGGSVDAVVCTEAFHFFDQAAALEEFNRVLAPGGRLLVSMINPRTTPGSRILRAQGRGTVGAGRWPTQSGMRRLLEAAGFEIQEQRRVGRLLGRVLPTVLTLATRRH